MVARTHDRGLKLIRRLNFSGHANAIYIIRLLNPNFIPNFVDRGGLLISQTDHHKKNVSSEFNNQFFLMFSRSCEALEISKTFRNI